MHAMRWHPLEGVHIDETCCKFLEQYWRDIILLADNLNAHGMTSQSDSLLTKTLGEIPLTALQNPTLVYSIAKAYAQASQPQKSQQVVAHLHHILDEQLQYYHTMPLRLQAAMPYTVGVREELATTIFLPLL